MNMEKQLKKEFSKFIHDEGKDNWLAFFQTYKNNAQTHGMTALEYWERETYPKVFKKDGTYRADRKRLLKLKEEA